MCLSSALPGWPGPTSKMTVLVTSNSEGEVPPVARVARRPAVGWRSRCYKGLLWLKSLRQALRWCLVVSFRVLLCRPFALRFAAKLIGGVLRLVARRLLSLLVLVLDQVFEELILQLAVVVEPASPFLADGRCPSYPTLGVLHQLVLSLGRRPDSLYYSKAARPAGFAPLVPPPPHAPPDGLGGMEVVCNELQPATCIAVLCFTDRCLQQAATCLMQPAGCYCQECLCRMTAPDIFAVTSQLARSVASLMIL